MVTVEDRVNAFVQSASLAQLEVFVASCVERAAPALFLALAGEENRTADSDAFMSLLDGLWTSAHLPIDARQAGMDAAMQFPELQGEEEPLGVLLFASHAEAALYYAYKFLSLEDRKSAAICSDSVQNSAGYVDDRARAGDQIYNEELELVAADLADLEAAADPWAIADDLRTRSQDVGRRRMDALRAALS